MTNTDADNTQTQPDPLARWRSRSSAVWRLLAAVLFGLTYLFLARFIGDRVAIALLAFVVARQIQSHENLRDCFMESLRVIQRSINA